MADLVVGLAKSAVEGTLTMARSAMEEEKKLQKAVQRDLMLISDEFEMMHAFLDSTKDDDVTDSVTRTLVRQVRDMALDVEDCIDSVLHLDKKQSNWWRRMLPSWMLPAARPGTDLDAAVANIEVVKSRVEAMGQRNFRYSRNIEDSGCHARQPAEHKEQHQQQPDVGDAAASSFFATARKAAEMQIIRQVGLVDLISKKKDGALQVISVLGTRSDLGVMSIKNAYDDPETYSSFRCRAWVKLMHPFNPHEFMRNVLTRFCNNNCPEQQDSTVPIQEATQVIMTATDSVLITEFRNYIGQKYLLILEDVLTMDDWEAVSVYLPDRNNCSCIVVHTQQPGIASFCVGQPHQLSVLAKFSDDHSVYALFNKVPVGASQFFATVRADTKISMQSKQVGLVELITRKKAENGALQVISVLETRNRLGVMSIRNAYDDPETCSTFRCRAWVKLMHPFSPEEFMRRLLARFYNNNCLVGQENTVDVHGLMVPILGRRFREQMSQKYLVILEDVLTTEDWEAVRVYLPDKNNGSCIVVHTTQPKIASFSVGEPHRVSEAAKFSAGHSVYVLFKEDEAGKVEEATEAKKRPLAGVRQRRRPAPLRLAKETVYVDRVERASKWLDQHPLVGRDMDLKNLYSKASINSLISDRRVSVVAVWGMSGVGKSSLVKRFYYQELINYRDSKKIKFGWVNISRRFDLVDLSRSLLLDLNPGYLQDCMMSTVQDPIQVCREYLHEGEGLIVFDGVQSNKDWDSAKVVFGGTFRGRIIVITNEESVAKYCATRGDEHMWNVKGLEVHHALELFKKVSCEPGIEEEMDTLHKCGGLPKVICAVADLYFYGRFDEEQNLVSELTTKKDMEDLFAWLHSYCRSSPDIFKDCIFYLSIFPLNHVLRRRRLVRRWIAEGYCRDNKKGTAEEDAETSFFKLSRSMILMPAGTALTYSERMPLFQVNDFFVEYINSQQMEDNHVLALKGRFRKNLQRTGRHLTIDETWDRNRNVFESIELSCLRSLIVFCKWESFFISDKMKLLRVLDLEDVCSGVTNDDIEKMAKVLFHLKFLSLRNCREITRLPDSVGDLKQLQTLDIRETSIVKLPKTIIKIEKLQYIRTGTSPQVGGDDDSSAVRDPTLLSERLPLSSPAVAAAAERPTSLAKKLISCSCAALVPNLLLKLSTTRHHPDEGSHHSGVKVPRGIGNLTNLHTLGVVNLSAAGWKDILKELKNLTRLHKLGVSGINKDNSRMFFSAISGLAHLQSLSLQVEANEDNGAGFLDVISSPPVNLLSLKLYGLGRNLPPWIEELHSLIKLSLHMTMLPQEGIHLLASLRSRQQQDPAALDELRSSKKQQPQLEILRLFLSEFQDDGLHFGGQEHPFDVAFLEISCNSRLQATITFHRDSCSVKVLRIRCSRMSSLQISGLSHIKHLEQVWLSGTYDDALKQNLENELANYPEFRGKPVLRLEKPGSPIPWLMSSS